MKRIPLVFFVASTVKLYKFFLSPVLPHSCRFFPSCSEYTVEALHKYGISKGLWFSLKRIAKCHPLNAGGHDPIN